MQRHFVLGLFLAVSLTMAACGDSGTTPQKDAGTTDTNIQLDALPPSDASQADAKPDGGQKPDSFANAAAITLNDTNGKSGSISPAGTVNYYKFEGTAGTWMFLYTDANPNDDPTMVDTVIQLFDSSQTMIAENDDAVPRVNTDSEIMIKLPSTGTYYVTVQEFSTWAGDPPKGGPTFIYKLFAIQPDAVPGVVEETEPNDTVGAATPMTYLSSATATAKGAFILGSFASGTDVDIYKFTVPAIPDGGVGTMWNVSFDIMPAGVNGYGATNPVGEAYITDATGATTIAKIDNSITKAPFELQPPLAAGDYLLYVKHPAAAAGANDFYVIKHNMFAQDNPVEAEGTATGVNDTLATAQALTLAATGTGSNAAFILASLPAGDAADYFKINVANATDVISLVCGAARNGSGMTGLNVSVHKADDTVVTGGTATEVLTDDLRINNLAVGAAGDYYIKLTPGTQAAGVTSSFVRCGFYVSPPPAP
ncbi:MAG TPA: PPC domain-containing protein [Polyangia bacterium]|jgi:hypothetical protein